MIRGGGIPKQPWLPMPIDRMGPSPRNLAHDANDCIMVGLTRGHRIQGCIAAQTAHAGEFSLRSSPSPEHRRACGGLLPAMRSPREAQPIIRLPCCRKQKRKRQSQIPLTQQTPYKVAQSPGPSPRLAFILN
jgi:hypothetical protein